MKEIVRRCIKYIKINIEDNLSVESIALEFNYSKYHFPRLFRSETGFSIVEETILDLKKHGVILGKAKKSKVQDECRWAYKDIDQVIEQELDLIKPIKKLKTVCVIKG